jgi:hypothetical protein
MKLRKIEKKGAMELSLSTIVIVVLSLTLLILGFVLVRSIMCSAIGLTGDVNDKVKAQLDSFFSSTGGEFACIGESGSSVTMIPGETNMIYCQIKAPEEARYKFEVDINYEASTISREMLREWFFNMAFDERVPPGDSSEKQIARMKIPRNAPEGDVVFRVQAYKDDTLIGGKTLNYKISQQGVVRGFIC